MSLRRAPYVGAPVTVAFLARNARGTIEEVGDEGRRVVVVTDDGELIAFTLSPATGNFIEERRPVGGARLTFQEA